MYLVWKSIFIVQLGRMIYFPLFTTPNIMYNLFPWTVLGYTGATMETPLTTGRKLNSIGRRFNLYLTITILESLDVGTISRPSIRNSLDHESSEPQLIDQRPLSITTSVQLEVAMLHFFTPSDTYPSHLIGSQFRSW